MLVRNEGTVGNNIVLDESFKWIQVNEKHSHVGCILRDCKCKHVAGPIFAQQSDIIHPQYLLFEDYAG